MLKVLSCIAVEHDPLFTFMAGLVCLAGAILTLQLFNRVRRTQAVLRRLWLVLAGLIGASAFWSTHFVAILGYESDIILGYDPFLTAVSLIVALAATTFGFWIAASTASSWQVEAGGAVVGAGIAAMHYIGMMALELHGRIEWDPAYVAASVILSMVFAVLAVNRVARPLTRFCRTGGVLAMVLGVVALHFTGMAAMTIVPNAIVFPPSNILSANFLAVGVIAVTSMLGTIALITYMIDLQNARNAGERYRHLALHDPLTGVANRAGLEEHLKKLIASHPGGAGRVAVFAVDLDRFKDINDVHGHGAGDEVLRTFASRASEALGAGEFLARFGGDEFVAVKYPVYSRRDADSFARKIQKIAAREVEWQSKRLSVSGSIGYALYPEDAKSTEALIECADLAMYSAKARSGSAIMAYDSRHATANRERSALAMDLVGAIERGEFELYYQPQNDAMTREIVGYEALLRWHHPERGTIPPDQFIPIAEKNGRIVELGAWALRTACREAASWKKPRTVAVNVAAAQLALQEFVTLVQEVLEETGLEPHRLELEITESGIIGDMPHALHMVRQLKGLGVAIAMDDFGTGYSSLSTLQNFPFDKIKIDREFIRNLDVNEHSAAIVRATIILGASLNKKILAEGVETEEQMAFLTSAGCGVVQGYLFGRPAPNGAMIAFEALSEKGAAQKDTASLVLAAKGAA